MLSYPQYKIGRQSVSERDTYRLHVFTSKHASYQYQIQSYNNNDDNYNYIVTIKVTATIIYILPRDLGERYLYYECHNNKQ